MREQRIKLPWAVLGLFTIHIECFKVTPDLSGVGPDSELGTESDNLDDA